MQLWVDEAKLVWLYQTILQHMVGAGWLFVLEVLSVVFEVVSVVAEVFSVVSEVLSVV